MGDNFLRHQKQSSACPRWRGTGQNLAYCAADWLLHARQYTEPAVLMRLFALHPVFAAGGTPYAVSFTPCAAIGQPLLGLPGRSYYRAATIYDLGRLL